MTFSCQISSKNNRGTGTAQWNYLLVSFHLENKKNLKDEKESHLKECENTEGERGLGPGNVPKCNSKTITFLKGSLFQLGSSNLQISAFVYWNIASDRGIAQCKRAHEQDDKRQWLHSVVDSLWRRLLGSLMMCGKKFFLLLAVLILASCIWKKFQKCGLGIRAVSDDVPCVLCGTVVIHICDVAMRGCATDVLYIFNGTLQSLPVPYGIVPPPHCDWVAQDALHCESGEVAEQFLGNLEMWVSVTS